MLVNLIITSLTLCLGKDSSSKAYQLSYSLYQIYNRHITPDIARMKLALWFNEIEQSGFNAFATIRRTFEMHYNTITNYFNERSINAAAESFKDHNQKLGLNY